MPKSISGFHEEEEKILSRLIPPVSSRLCSAALRKAADARSQADKFLRRGFVQLIDEYLPEYYAREIHRTQVHAPASRIYCAFRTTDLAEAMVVRMCLALRALPGAFLSPMRGLRHFRIRLGASMTLREFEIHGFRVLAENPPHELLIGLMGSFWKLNGGLSIARPRAPAV